MTDERDRTFLLDMSEAAQRILRYLGDRSQADLDSDDMLLDAVVRQFEVLGEAARSVSPGTRERWPRIPWRAMIGMRNQLIHAYKAVDTAAVWRTAHEDLPALLTALRSATEQGRG